MDVMFENSAMNILLEAELAAGNRIAEVSAWLPKCKKFILLEHRFSRNYDEPSLQFNEVNDPHYWLAEYEASGGEEVLACKFKNAAV